MPAGKRVQRASAPQAPQPAAAVAAAPKPTPAPTAGTSLIVDLDAAVRAALVRGDHAAHAALSEIYVAAGLLKAKAATRAQELAGADRDLAQKVHALL